MGKFYFTIHYLRGMAKPEFNEAADFLEAAGRLSEHERLYLHGEADKESGWREAAIKEYDISGPGEASFRAEISAWNKLRALIEAIEEGEDG